MSVSNIPLEAMAAAMPAQIAAWAALDTVVFSSFLRFKESKSKSLLLGASPASSCAFRTSSNIE